MGRKKLIIGLGIAFLISIIFLVISFITKPKEAEVDVDGIKFPTHKELLKDVTVGDVKIEDVSLLTRNGISTFKAKVVNYSEEDLTINKLVVVITIDGNEERIEILRNAKISSNGYSYINLTSEKDLTDLEDIKYELE